MTRTSITVNTTTRTETPPSEPTALTITTIDGTLQSVGLAITDFFNHKDSKLVVYNSVGSDKTITLVAGTNDKCIKKGIGNKSITITNGSYELIDQIESARFDSGDGDLYIDFESGFTSGTIYAVGTKHGGVS